MAKQTKKTIEQLLLDQIANLGEQIAEIRARQQVQQPVVGRKKTKGQPRPDVYYVLSGVPSQGLPPQAIACARILATAKDTNHIPEEEAMDLIESAKAAGRLHTTQDAWHIFQYYRAKLIEGNYLRMLTV
jgi:hypothetical protein